MSHFSDHLLISDKNYKKENEGEKYKHAPLINIKNIQTLINIQKKSKQVFSLMGMLYVLSRHVAQKTQRQFAMKRVFFFQLIRSKEINEAVGGEKMRR